MAAPDRSVQLIKPAFDGIDVDSAPDYIPDTKAPTIQNFLVDREGRLPMRGPIYTQFADWTGTITTIAKMTGCWVFNDNVLFGFKNPSTTAIHSPWEAPRTKPSSSGALATSNANMIHVALPAGTTSTVTPAANTQCIGPAYARLGEYVYGISFGSVANSNEQGGYLPYTQIIRWDGTTTAPVVYANAPEASQDIIAHYQRLFVAGGRDPGGTNKIQNNTLWFSDQIDTTAVGGVLADTVAAWQDDVSGLTNRIVVGQDDGTDYLVGLAHVGENLVIFKRHGIFILSGYDSTTFNCKQFSKDVGCMDKRSICQYEDGVFFMSDQGLQYFDGSTLTHVTKGLKSSAVQAAVTAVGDSSTPGGYCRVERLQNNYISLVIGYANATTGTYSVPTFSGIYHVPRGTWSTLESDNFTLTSQKPVFFARTLNNLIIGDDSIIYDASKLVSPENAPASQRGFDSKGNVFRIDSLTAFSGTSNTLKNSALVEAFPSTTITNSPIKAKFYSKFFRLGTPSSMSMVYRVLVDYEFNVSGAQDSTTANGWYVSLVGNDGRTLLTETQVKAAGDTTLTAFAQRRRATFEVIDTEAEEARIKIEWKGSNALALEKASLFDSVIEYGGTRLRPTE